MLELDALKKVYYEVNLKEITQARVKYSCFDIPIYSSYFKNFFKCIFECSDRHNMRYVRIKKDPVYIK